MNMPGIFGAVALHRRNARNCEGASPTFGRMPLSLKKVWGCSQKPMTHGCLSPIDIQ
jgi:hypothetical protein